MRGRVLVPAIAVAWAALLSVLGLWKYSIFRADVDAGIFTQVLLSFGSGFHSTVEGNANHLLVHFSPMLVVLVPFVRAIGDARALVIAQAVLHALVVFPVYGIARKRTSETWAIAIAATSMLYPVLWAAAFTDFHEAAFVPVLAATLVWALDSRRFAAALVTALAMMCCKEDQFVILLGVGLIAALVWRSDRQMVRCGLAISLMSVAFAILYFKFVRFMFPIQIDYWSLHFYDWSYAGGAPQGFAELWSTARPFYLWWALVPLAFIPLRSRFALFAIPGFIEVLASHQMIALSLGTHYVAGWVGFMLAAFAAGAADLSDSSEVRTRWAVLAAPLLCAFTLFFHDPMARWYFLYRPPNAHDARLEETLATLPRESSIGAEDEIFAHLANRPGASLGPSGQDYFIYDRSHYSDQWQRVDEPKLRALIAGGKYRTVSDTDGIVVVKRVGSP